MEEILRLFPERIRQAIHDKIGNRWGHMQEIRFRLQQPVELVLMTMPSGLGMYGRNEKTAYLC